MQTTSSISLYLESFNEEKGTHLVNAGGIHYEPFGLYPGTETSLDNIDNATIAVPNDTTNECTCSVTVTG